MKKSDLKNGMIVEQRNGSKSLVMIGGHSFDDCMVNSQGFDVLGYYTEDLKNNTNRTDYDIMKVYRTEVGGAISSLMREGKPLNITLLWDREKHIEDLKCRKEELLKQIAEIDSQLK